MIDEPELVEFRHDDPAAISGRMAALVRDRNGWINFQPGIDAEDEPPPPSPLSGLLTGRGPAVPLATWTPGERKRRRVEPTTIGLQHGAGAKAVARLLETGHPVPEGWRVVADHPRRGLVMVVPDDADHEQVVAWLVRAGELLTPPSVPLTGMWRAAVYVVGPAPV